MELAAAAHKRHLAETVLDLADRVMERVVTPSTSRYFADAHRSWGTDFRLNTTVTSLQGDEGRVTAGRSAFGEDIPADIVVVAVGVVPNSELAADAGLECADGIVVDEYLRTADPRISAIGDCARFRDPISGRQVRLESVQAATGHARCVAARLTGQPAHYYDAVPWFWTHQGGLKLQIAGIGAGADKEVIRGDPASGRFSVFAYRADKTLRLVSSIRR